MSLYYTMKNFNLLLRCGSLNNMYRKKALSPKRDQFYFYRLLSSTLEQDGSTIFF